jgi:hypothetical protein
MFVKFCTKASAMAVLCASVLAPMTADAGVTKLQLINGWHNYDSSTNKPGITAIKGVAYFQGAIRTSGTNAQPFVLPAAFRPASTIYTKVDLCNAHNGRLQINPDGSVEVEAVDFSQAQCFTSLEGVSFALSSDGYKAAKLKNGWEDTIYGTAAPATNANAGMVSLEGAMSSSGSNVTAFTLPASQRPSATVYIPADMFGSTNGRLIIDTDGTVSVESETDNSEAFDFTSLEGISFAVNSTGFTPISLINGWTPYGTRNPAVRVSGKLVQFQGSISTSGSNSVPFVLPSNMRPKKRVYIPIDLCDATNGRLDIGTDGTVNVETEGDFSDAQCFTSLEGAWFLQ